jgi:hypothetical protein
MKGEREWRYRNSFAEAYVLQGVPVRRIVFEMSNGGGLFAAHDQSRFSRPEIG